MENFVTFYGLPKLRGRLAGLLGLCVLFVAVLSGVVAQQAQAAPVILTQSPSTTVVAGGSLTMGVAVSGSGTLSYQWRKRDTAVVTTLAGSGVAGSANGTGASATFNGPVGLAVDSAGNYYVADYGSHKIRKITPTGVVTTLAGSGTAGSADGTGSAATFNHPIGVAVDSQGNVYIAEYSSHKIRKVTTGGVVTTLAGTGAAGSADGSAAAATFYNPVGVAVDVYGNVYVGDYNSNKIRKITTGGVVSTLAGSGVAGSVDGTGSSATFDHPQSVAVTMSGDVIVSEIGNKIRKVTASGVVSTIAGSGTASAVDGIGVSATFNVPYGVAVDAAGNIYVADSVSNRIRKVTPSGLVSTLAGSIAGNADGVGSSATFDNPEGICVDSGGNVCVADYANNKIRKITLGTAIAGATSATYTIPSATAGDAGDYDCVVTGNGGSVASVPTSLLVFTSTPVTTSVISGGSVTLSAGAVGTGSLSYQWRKRGATGTVTTFAGSGATGSADGTGTAATFNGIQGCAVDVNGNTYAADYSNHKIRKITAAGVVTTFAGSGATGSADGQGTSASFSFPAGVAVDGFGNVYVADPFGNRIRKITPSGLVSTLAGNGTASGVDGTGTGATFNSPWGLTFDAYGVLYVAEAGGHRVRKVSPSGVVTTLAGSGVAGSADGTGAAATFNGLQKIAVDKNGVVYVADYYNNKVRKITAAGVVTTIAGSGVLGGLDGIGTSATFGGICGLSLDVNGSLYVSDHDTHKIRKVTVGGVVSTYAGSGAAGGADGTGTAATFTAPADVSVDGAGNLFVASNNTMRKITTGTNIGGATGVSYTLSGAAVGDAADYDVVVTDNATGISWASPAASLFVFTTQPVANTTLSVGGSLSLSVAATGQGTLTYQWQKNGVNISGATSATYSIGTVVSGDAGTYTVVITDGATGLSITSSGAVVSVPGTSSVAFAQVSGSSLVDVSYAMSGGSYAVGLAVSLDGGSTYALPVKSVTGDVGALVASGTSKHIFWNAGVDLPAQNLASVKVRVSSWNLSGASGGTFVRINGGTYSIGNLIGDVDVIGDITNSPVTSVSLSPYYIQSTHTTKTQWDTVRTWASTHGYTDLAGGAGKAGNHPVQTVSWYDVVKWANAASEMDGLTPCYIVSGAVYRTGTNAGVVCDWTASGYRLPSEAEWEVAARGGLSGKRFPLGDTISWSQANYASDNYPYDLNGPSYALHSTYAVGGTPYTSPVGSFAANGYGLFDMAGNVNAWCWDWYGSYSGEPNPHGSANGSNRVFRGGAWPNGAHSERCGTRDSFIPSNQSNNVGFRLARGSNIDASSGTASALGSVNTNPAVTAVVFAQQPGTKLVDIMYSLSGNTSAVALGVSLDGGTTFAGTVNTVSGHVGASVSTGTSKAMQWNVGVDLAGQSSSNVKMRIRAWDQTQGGVPFVAIPGGTFQMGNLIGDGDITNAGTVSVTLSPYFMQAFHTTKAQWDLVRTWGASNGYTDLAAGAGKASNHPVQTVSWYDVVKWSNAASEKEGLTPCYKVGGVVYRTGNSDAVVCDWTANGYRLPTEAEWEIAARGGLTGKRFPLGDTISWAQANYKAGNLAYDLSGPTVGYHSAYNDGAAPYTSPVGSFGSNGYGLNDMAGNLDQWCWDWYGTPYAAGSDPRGPGTGSTRVLRGASWSDEGYYARCAQRRDYAPSVVDTGIGFRLVRGRP